MIGFTQTLSTAVSMTASFNTSSIDISSYKGYSVQATWTGATSAGSNDVVIVQGSNDDTNYGTVESTATNATSGTLIKNYDGINYKYMRVNFTRSAATAGTMTIIVTGKLP